MSWQVATIVDTIPETPEAVTLRLEVPGWRGHLPGQHVDVQLTAEDGYRAQRSYSIASVPNGDRVELTVVRLSDGEVSPYLTTIAGVGDQVEVRGPIGGHFVWRATDQRPVLLVGGGSGVVPLMAMLRTHAASGHRSRMHLVYSARTAAELLYPTELVQLAGSTRQVSVTLTRETQPTWQGRRGRIDAELLAEAGPGRAGDVSCFVCGPTPFVEAAADALVQLGHAALDIKTERFGPSGG